MIKPDPIKLTEELVLIVVSMLKVNFIELFFRDTILGCDIKLVYLALTQHFRAIKPLKTGSNTRECCLKKFVFCSS